MITLSTPAAPLVILALTALAVLTGPGLAGLTTNTGPHGFSEIIYASTSSFANNGQNFAAHSANTPIDNLTTTLAMLAGRFVLGILALALAGLFAESRTHRGMAALPTDTLLFGGILVGTALMVGALTYFPGLALGPFIAHPRMIGGG